MKINKLITFFKKPKVLLILFCFCLSFVILLLTSKCSFLYPFNDWVDANAFFTVGKSMMRGIVPYKDLFEQKGIFLYLIYGIGYLISNTTFIGVFFLEVIAWTITLYYCAKIIIMFLPKKSIYLILPIFICLITTSKVFVHGGSAEEFTFPLMAISLYYLICHFKEKELAPKEFILNGILAGLVFLNKYTMLGFWFAFMMCLFFDLFFKKEYRKSFVSCLYFLLGMSFPIIIALIYLGINHAIDDFIHVYFVLNMTSYSKESTSFLIKIFEIFESFFKSNKNLNYITMILVYGFPFALIPLNTSKASKISIFMLIFFHILTIYFGLRTFKYYFLPFLFFILISLIGLMKLILKNKYLKTFIQKYSIIINIIVIFISVFIAYNRANYKEFRNVSKNELFQYEFRDIILKEENPSLLNVGHLDCGLYTTTNLVPTTYYFEKQNFDYNKFPDNIDSLYKYIFNKDVMFVIYFSKFDINYLFENEKVLINNYDLVASAEQEFEKDIYKAYLFKVKDVSYE